MYEFPFRVGLLDITHDHRQVSRALDRVLGMRQLDRGLYSLLPSEITEITASDADTLQRVISRECFAGDIGCPDAIRMEAHGIASSLETEAGQRLGELSRLAESLSGLQGRRQVVAPADSNGPFVLTISAPRWPIASGSYTLRLTGFRPITGSCSSTVPPSMCTSRRSCGRWWASAARASSAGHSSGCRGRASSSTTRR